MFDSTVVKVPGCLVNDVPPEYDEPFYAAVRGVVPTERDAVVGNRRCGQPRGRRRRFRCRVRSRLWRGFRGRLRRGLKLCGGRDSDIVGPLAGPARADGLHPVDVTGLRLHRGVGIGGGRGPGIRVDGGEGTGGLVFGVPPEYHVALYGRCPRGRPSSVSRCCGTPSEPSDPVGAGGGVLLCDAVRHRKG